MEMLERKEMAATLRLDKSKFFKFWFHMSPLLDSGILTFSRSVHSALVLTYSQSQIPLNPNLSGKYNKVYLSK